MSDQTYNPTYPVLAVTDTTTAQEVFDAVVVHLRRQGRRSVSQKGYCAYRGPSGLACAVGCLVDDETAGAWDASDDAAVDLVLVEGHALYRFIDLLRGLQSAHDDRGHWSRPRLNVVGESELRAVASDHGLAYTPPTSPEVSR